MENKELQKFSQARFLTILLLSVIGIGLCVELGMIFYKTNFILDGSFQKSFCSVSELIDCDGVAQTSYALTLGVPNAIWGFILYLIFIFLLFVDKIKEKFPNTIFDVFKNPRSYIATIGLISFILSMVLAFISINVIHKICALCFCTYFINLFIALIARTKGFFLDDIKNTVLDFIAGAKKYFILFLIVLVGVAYGLYYLDKTLILSPKLKEESAYKEFQQAKTNKYAVKGNILGHKNAKVTINVYSDMNCPFCRVVNIMVHKAAKERKIIVNEVNLPLDSSCNSHIFRTLGGHENSCLYSKYALAAKKQGKMWGVINTFFDYHPQGDEQIIQELKKAHLGLNYDKLTQDVNSEEITKELLDDIETAQKKGINATPSMEINGVVYIGAMRYDELLQKIDLAIKREEK